MSRVRVAGALAEFATPREMLDAMRALRDGGFRPVDTFTPYPVDGVEEALELRRSTIPRWVLGAGVFGAIAAYVVQWWTSAVDYPLIVGGRPLNSIPAWIPITFETTILCAATAAFLALCFKTRMTALWHPAFEVDGFERAQVDRFWVLAEQGDGTFDVETELRRLGALRVVHLEGA